MWMEPRRDLKEDAFRSCEHRVNISAIDKKEPIYWEIQKEIMYGQKPEKT